MPTPFTTDFFSAVLQAVQATAPLEVAGVVTGVVCVWLAARNSVWNFPVGLVSCALYIVIFGQARLYSDAGLQVAFIALGIYGWWEWLRGNAAGHPEQPMLPITRTSPRLMAWLGGAGLLYAAGAGFLFSTYTDAALPYWDSTTTAVSLVAQGLLSRRKIENWLLWIGVDVAYVGMYWHRHLYLTSALYAVFLAIAAYGYWQWRQEYRRQPTIPVIS